MKRPSLEAFLTARGRRLLYGRRKTGKTFYARKALPDYDYFIVMHGGRIYDPGTDTVLDTQSFLRLCRRGVKIILDEFHRAEPRVFYAVQAGECGDDLVFITSTLHYHTRLTAAPGAPLKGMFVSRRVGLISPRDLLAMDWGLEGPELIERLVLYVEPPMIGLDPGTIVASSLEYSNALVGEVFSEEDLTLTRRFTAIMEAIAAGRTRPTEISGYLTSKGLLPKDSASLISKYLRLMVDIGLLEAVPILGRRRGRIYRHVSPVTEIAYYLSTRYGFGDTPLSEGFLMRVFRQRLPLLIERFVETFLAEVTGLRPVKVLEPEVDIVLTRYAKPALVAEVKWVSKVRREDLRKVEEKLSAFKNARKILIVPDASTIPETELEVWDAHTLKQVAVTGVA